MGTETDRFWSLAENVTTLAIVGTTGLEGTDDGGHYTNSIGKLWTFYKDETTRYDLSRRINKAIYARTVVNSGVFCNQAVLQLGFQTMLYRCTLKLTIADIFQCEEGEYNDHDHHLYVDTADLLALKVERSDIYTLNQADLEEMVEQEKETPNDGDSGKCHNPTAEFFARKNCTHLEDSQLTSLTRDNLLEHFGFAGTLILRKLVKHLINRYVTQ